MLSQNGAKSCPPRGGCEIRLGPKGTWSGPGIPNFPGADVVPPAERRDLNHPCGSTCGTW